MRPSDVGIRVKDQPGQHKVRCPQCDDIRTDKEDRSLSVKIEDGKGWTANCKYCGWSSGYDPDRQHFKSEVKRALVINEISVDLSPLSLNLEHWFQTERCISSATLDAYGMAAKTLRHQRFIAFPFVDHTGRLIGVKYRSPDKEIMWEKGSSQPLFGWQACKLPLTSLTIAEGEIDALALAEAGVPNATSVPGGASDSKMTWLDMAADVIEACPDVILAGDQDAAGRPFMEELARRIGYGKCRIAAYPADCKDPNDVLKKYGPAKLKACIDQADYLPIVGCFKASDFKDKIFQLWEHGPDFGKSTGLSNLDDIWLIRRGELIVVTGFPNQGKSELVDQVCINCAELYGWRVGLCSFENERTEHFRKLAQKRTRKSFDKRSKKRVSRDEVAQVIRWMDDHLTWIDPPAGTPTIDEVLDICRAMVMRHGLEIIVIDPYNRLDCNRKEGISETEHIAAMLGKVQAFAQHNQVAVFFVAHPAKMPVTKEGKRPVPHMMDISGSAHWSNMPDCVLAVGRDFESGLTEVHTRKIRNVPIAGFPGQVAELAYDIDTSRYYCEAPARAPAAYDPLDLLA